MSHLVILPCHSVWRPTLPHSRGESRDEWELVDFQIEGYDHYCFIDHIHTSFNILRQNQNAHLIISGGQTKIKAGPLSEAQSYYNLSQRLVDDAKELSLRVHVEEFARDSFENVIFLLCKFYEVHKQYPSHLTIVGFEFKRGRFLENHLKQALNWKLPENITYIGNAPNPKDLLEKEQEAYFQDLYASEKRFAVDLFEQDWYGCKGKLLLKKQSRNPFGQKHNYHESNPYLSAFLNKSSRSDLDNEVIRDELEGLPWTA